MKQWRVDLEYEVAIDEEGASGNHAKKANTLVGGGAEGASADATHAVTPDGVPAASVNILSTEPYPCNGSSSALISGYYAALGVADYFKNS